MLLAAYVIQQHKAEQVIIFSSSGILQTQLEKKQRLLPGDMQSRVLVENVEYMDDMLDIGDKTFYIFDEADLIIENSLVRFADQDLKGMFAYRNEQCYLFTATLEDYWKKCW